MIGDVDPGVLWEYAKGRHSDFLQAAAADRWSHLGRPRGPRLGQRLALALGDQLIALGLRLKQRYDPRPASGHL